MSANKPANLMPQRKVAAGGFASALTAVLVWPAREFVGVEVPAEVAAALTAVIGFAVAWWVPSARVSESSA